MIGRDGAVLAGKSPEAQQLRGDVPVSGAIEISGWKSVLSIPLIGDFFVLK